MEPIAASNLKDFLTALKQEKVEVSRQRSMRSNDECEFWVLQRALPHVLKQEIQGTVTLRKSEQPDFILDIGEYRLGIEITELIKKNVAHALSKTNELAETLKVYSLGEFHRGSEVPSSPDEMIKLLDLKRGKPWLGDEPEEETARLCKHGLQSKENKAADYQKCSRLIVIGYISKPPVPLDFDMLERMVEHECASTSLCYINEYHILCSDHCFRAA